MVTTRSNIGSPNGDNTPEQTNVTTQTSSSHTTQGTTTTTKAKGKPKKKRTTKTKKGTITKRKRLLKKPPQKRKKDISSDDDSDSDYEVYLSCDDSYPQKAQRSLLQSPRKQKPQKFARMNPQQLEAFNRFSERPHPSTQANEQASSPSSSKSNENDNNIQSLDDLPKGFVFPSNAVILPRKNNKKIGNQTNIVYTEANINRYSSIVNRISAVDFDRTKNKKRFVMKFVQENFDDIPVYEYNEKKSIYEIVYEKELNLIVKKRLENLLSRIGKKELQKLKASIGNKKQRQEVEEMRFYTLSGSVYTSGSYTSKNNLSGFENLYEGREELPGYKDWNFYSMFHTGYQSFSFVVYNYSHRLKNGEVVHRTTRVKLVFPRNANCILIIHGRLVHSGSATKSESSSSFNASHDLRLFAYLSNLAKRQDRVSTYDDPLEQDTVDTATFRLCKEDCTKCQECELYRLKSQSDFETINIGDLLNANKSKFKRKKTCMTQQTPQLVIGNMEELGWEVYTGIDTSFDKYQNLQSQFNEAVLGKGKDLWNGINNTKRMAFKIDKLLGEQNLVMRTSMSLVFLLFKDILDFILKDIPYLGKDIQYDGRALLANFDYLLEQKPHRDFSQTKKTAHI